MAHSADAIKVPFSVLKLKPWACASKNYRHKLFSCLRNQNISARPRNTTTSEKNLIHKTSNMQPRLYNCWVHITLLCKQKCFTVDLFGTTEWKDFLIIYEIHNLENEMKEEAGKHWHWPRVFAQRYLGFHMFGHFTLWLHKANEKTYWVGVILENYLLHFCHFSKSTIRCICLSKTQRKK